MRKSFTISMIAIIFITLGCGAGGGAGGGAGAVGGQTGSAASPFSVSVSTAFTAGISHIDGKYRFTQNNYLLEGAQKISDLGSSSIFIYPVERKTPRPSGRGYKRLSWESFAGQCTL